MKKAQKQTFLAQVYDKNDKYIDFQRFGCKRLSTVIKQMKWLCAQTLYKAITKDISYVLIYKTEYDTKTPPVAVIQF